MPNCTRRPVTTTDIVAKLSASIAMLENWPENQFHDLTKTQTLEKLRALRDKYAEDAKRLPNFTHTSCDDLMTFAADEIAFKIDVDVPPGTTATFFLGTNATLYYLGSSPSGSRALDRAHLGWFKKPKTTV